MAAVSLTDDIQQRAKASAAGRMLGTGATDTPPFPWRELTGAQVADAIGTDVIIRSAAQRTARDLGVDDDTAPAPVTLDISKPRISIGGTAAAAFDYVLPDGLVDLQEVWIDVSTNATFGGNTVRIEDSDGSVVTSLARGIAYQMRWIASDGTWSRGIVTPRDIGLVHGSGSPVGVLLPEFAWQEYRDTTNNEKWQCNGGESDTSWFRIGVGASGDAAPTVVEFTASAPLTTAHLASANVQVYAGANGVDFDVPINTVGSWIIRAYDKDDDTPRSGCTVSVFNNAGEVNDSAGVLGIREIAPGGTAIVTSTGGAIPSVKVTGNIFEPDSSRGATTFLPGDAAVFATDHQRSITITGNQVIQVTAANVKAGFTAVYWASGGDRTINGLDADHIIPSGGAATVHKTAAGALVCVGAKTTSPGITVLDAF